MSNRALTVAIWLVALLSLPAHAATSSAAAAHPELTASDLGAWLDGIVPYAIHQSDVAGAVVVVVRDDKILFQKGYGYADTEARRPVDPATTLFRVASISKLFTWTAVMQLVEQHKLDLDTDVNRYLDFEIPSNYGKPITLRALMTHTAGFEEQEEDGTDARVAVPLGQYVRAHLPRRIFPPLTTPAYSNYGAGLAGYIVERVSGEPFESYLERHIFAPLGMTHTSFHQPLPPQLAHAVSNGYELASGPSQPFEITNPAPAGAISTSGSDIARFMLAHLNDGRFGDVSILRPATARQMHATAFRTVPTINGMALGFFEENRNGHRIIGHDGDLSCFHSLLSLIMDQRVGLFVSLNSAGSQANDEPIRLQLLHEFVDRYFPAPMPDRKRLASAPEDANKVAGVYELSRRHETTVLSMLNLLEQLDIGTDDKGDLTATAVDDLLGSPHRSWREVAPFVWQEMNGRSHFAAAVKDGRVVSVTTDDIDAGAVLQPVPIGIRKSWLLPALAASATVLAAAVLLWPLGALVRWRCGLPSARSQRATRLNRWVRMAAAAELVVLGGWLALIVDIESSAVNPGNTLDPWFRFLQLLAALGLLGLLTALINLIETWRDSTRSWWDRFSSIAIVCAMALVLWAEIAFNVFNLSLAY